MFRVSGLNLEPINSIIAPIDMFNASANGIRLGEKDSVFDNRDMAMIGDHEPIISPPL
jgi:hypothetical protein